MRLYKVGILISGLILLITSCDNDSVQADRVEENRALSKNSEQVTIGHEVTGAVPVSPDKTTDMAIINNETSQREIEITESLELRNRDRAAIENEKLSMQSPTAKKP